MALEMLYFAWVREKIGAGAETVSPPPDVATVADLIGWLAGRSAGHADAMGTPERLRAAVDQRFVGFDAVLGGAREVALFSTGHRRMIDVRLQAEDFSTVGALARLESLGGGGVASFTGMVRGDDGLVELFLEHHPRMTLARMEEIAAEAAARWPLLGLVVVHRHGPLRTGERIVLVATAARHRAAALEACAFLIDWLKTSAPFWKRERFADGRSRWVEARTEDDAAAHRWAMA